MVHNDAAWEPPHVPVLGEHVDQLPTEPARRPHSASPSYPVARADEVGPRQRSPQPEPWGPKSAIDTASTGNDRSETVGARSYILDMPPDIELVLSDQHHTIDSMFDTFPTYRPKCYLRS